jgi:RsiW-degrading membrane proteinase PrsW (M82 family)
MIPVVCPGCSQKYKAPEAAAGRSIKCKACGTGIEIPRPPEPEPEQAAADILLGDATFMGNPLGAHNESMAFGYRVNDEEPPPQRKKIPVSYTPPKPMPTQQTPLTADETPAWRRHLHWVLALAMVPLFISLLAPTKQGDIEERFEQTLRELKPEQAVQVLSKINKETTDTELVQFLPEQKIKGAWLPVGSGMPWLLALGSALLFLTFCVFLGSDGATKGWQVLLVGLFTATAGVLLLLAVQAIAANTRGVFVGGRGIGVAFFWIFKLIGISYDCATDPSLGFIPSFFGYTFGVGLCEELAKLIPLVWYFKATQDDDQKDKHVWRGLLIWGLASGAGFGICEGLMYSHRHYNGFMGAEIYAVRFLSCVALHAIWSGSVGMMMHLRQEKISASEGWPGWIGQIVLTISVPMVMHGLYDVALKEDMVWLALVVAAASFGWLAWLSRGLHKVDDAAATKEMLKEYKRRRKAMQG